jgi:alkylation response protein AidB-like acyl-CoA dehydrogenase
MLVRTKPDGPKHGGISWIIMPMDLPGIEIRPLPTLLGETDFSEVFLEDVRIPVENLVGAENDGWRVTNVTLRFERGTAWAADIIELQQMLHDMAGIAQHLTRDGVSAWDDRALRREIAHMSAEAESLWAMTKLQVSELAKTGVPGLGGSVLKLAFTELNQRVYELATQLLGRAGLSRSDVGELPVKRIVEKYLNTLSLTIAAGSSQIQRNILSERLLGQPKDRR